MSDDCSPTGIQVTWSPTASARVTAWFAAMPQLTLPGLEVQTDDTDPTPPAGVRRHLRLIQGDKR